MQYTRTHIQSRFVCSIYSHSHCSTNAVSPTVRWHICITTEHSNALRASVFVWRCRRTDLKIDTKLARAHTRLDYQFTHATCIAYQSNMKIVCPHSYPKTTSNPRTENLKIRPSLKLTQNAAGHAQQQQRHNPLGRCHVRIHFEGQQQHARSDGFRWQRFARTHFTSQFVLRIPLADTVISLVLVSVFYTSTFACNVYQSELTLIRSLAHARDYQIHAVCVLCM